MYIRSQVLCWNLKDPHTHTEISRLLQPCSMVIEACIIIIVYLFQGAHNLVKVAYKYVVQSCMTVAKYL